MYDNVDDDIRYLLIFSLVLATIGFIVKAFVANASIQGLSVIAVATFIIVLCAYALLDRESMKKSAIQVVGEILIGKGMPILLFLGIVIWALTIVISRKELVLGGEMPKDFYSFLNITTFTFFIEIVLIYYYINTMINKTGTSENETFNKVNQMIGNQIGSLILLATIVNLMVVGILDVINKSFVTDG